MTRPIHWIDALNSVCKAKDFTLDLFGEYQSFELPTAPSSEERVKIGVRKLRHMVDDDLVSERVRDIGHWPNGVSGEIAARHWAMMVIDAIDQAEKPPSEWATTSIACMLVYTRDDPPGKTMTKTGVMFIYPRACGGNGDGS